MQPTFIPWLGYFALLNSVDHFVHLDHVNYSPRSWHSRNRIKTAQGELLLSLPIESVHSSLTINQANIAQSYNHNKTLKRISSNYAKAPHVNTCLQIIDDAYSESNGSLSAFNIGITSRISQHCGINTQTSKSSDITDISGTKGRLIYNICHALGASLYLSPIGSLDYLQDDNPFTNSEIDLRFINFSHPAYPQGKSPFVPNMSAIDALAWIGPAQLANLLTDSVGQERTIEEQSRCVMGRAA